MMQNGSNLSAYNARIGESKGYKGRMSFTRSYLQSQLFLSDDEISALKLEERFKPLPMRLLVELSVSLISYEFGKTYGVNYTEVNPTQVMRDIEELENGNVKTADMKPVHKEYISLWARELKKLFGEVEEMKRQFPPQAYETQTKKGPTMQESMDELFRQ
ncbi:MAG: hypothetical protein HY516_05200 [Candidatus Aenigmarchaeota archaeon]|nr:hypothetical protein [Candidatus Aenigmarchaeota archaeon]